MATHFVQKVSDEYRRSIIANKITGYCNKEEATMKAKHDESKSEKQKNYRSPEDDASRARLAIMP